MLKFLTAWFMKFNHEPGFLTKEEIQEFKKLAKEIMNIELTDMEAEDQGGRLIQSFELMIRNKKLKRPRV